MKKVVLLALFLSICWLLKAQPYGNEWIDYSQVHYKIKVTQDGLYRIPYSSLSAVIPNLSAVNTANFIMYHNGQAVPIYVSATGTLGSGDYIEFYGRKNIGDVDSFLYKTADIQPHPYYSLFTDTSIYFLTIKNGTGNPRFIETNNSLVNLPPKENYFIHTVRQVYAGRYYEGKYYSVSGEEVYKSSFEDGEGFVNSAFFGTVSSGSPSQQTQLNFNIATPYINYSGPDANYYTVFINNSFPDNHAARIGFNTNSNLYTQTSAQGFRLNKNNFTIPLSQLNNTGNNTITFTESSFTASSKKQNAVCLNEISYPRDFNFGGQNTFYFQLAADPINKKYLEINNFNDEGFQPVLYDLTNKILIRSTSSPGTSPLRFALPPSTVKRDLYLVSGGPNSYTTITQITPLQFANYSASNLSAQGDYLIISNTGLYDDGNGNNRVEEYRKYRDIDDNPGVGKYHARIYDIEQLYDQFAYGVRKSPLAIRNFIQYAENSWSIRPNYVFMIGKGREYNVMRNGGGAYNQCLIPTFGFPGSDNLYSGSRASDMPGVSVGRLAATNTQEIKDYLDKVKDYELAQNTYDEPQAIAPKLWQKHLLHFSGGTGSTEQGQFSAYINSYKRIAEDTLWGTRVNIYNRVSNNPIDESQSQLIKQQINDGVSVITFFGHSATGAFDFSVDEPKNYTNYGKYPIFISNGCFAGLIHDASPGYSEKFVFQPNAGAIAFMATTSLSVSSSLNLFTTNLYKEFCNPLYTHTLGNCFSRALADVYSGNPNDRDLMVAYEMTLHGDPGISFNQYPKPDYAIEQTSVFFTPATITPGLDSFEVNVVVTNLGKAIKDSIAVTLKRTAFDANGNPVVYNYRKEVRGAYYQDTVTFKLPTIFSSVGHGENQFSPYVDADFAIDEMSELNNGLLSPVIINIQQDDVIPIYPYEFAIVPQQGVTLKASTVNPFAAPRNYIFEIDTTEFYNSPLKQSQTVYQSGGVLHWTPTLQYIDSTVYYWRVAIDSTTPNWHYTSFVYIQGEDPGWNQSHYFQWQKDNFVNIIQDSDRIFKFPPTTNEIKVITGIADAVGGNLDYNLLGWDYNNNNMYRYRMGGCGFTRGITFAVIDNTTGLPWSSLNTGNIDQWGDEFGNYHCADKYYEQFGFDFLTQGIHPTGSNPAWSGLPWTTLIKNFIDAIPCGFYVLVYSTNNPVYSNWDTTLVNSLQNLGFAQAGQFASGQVNGPFVFFTQKCNNAYPSYFSSLNGYSTPLNTTLTFNGIWYQGNFTSPKIGPAFEWISMHWKHAPRETPTADLDTVDIIGVGANGVETVLLSTTNLDNLNLSSSINAQQYPYIRLRLRTYDDSLRTPTQLKYWRVLYKKPPEAAMNPAAHFVFTDSLSMGGNLHLELGLENVTDIPMDSMLTHYTIRDATLATYLDTIRYDSLKGLAIMHLVFNKPINGNNYSGANKIIVEANPDGDQLEQYHFNNFAELDFRTLGDKINPLLDVTFDGQHIFNGDIVSAKPDILMTLKDENQFLALNDSALVNVYLKYPGETNPRSIPYDNTILKFYPADSTQLHLGNKAIVEFTPELNLDGTYELTVHDRDRSGNTSSQETRNENNRYYDYKISFEVINKPMVTNVLNYPNPFTTSTRFVFTITGSQVPDYMKIQIMTIKGTVVKEITKEELGPIRVGRNITEYAWNGRDQYGDLLANGVYFYRVITRLDNKQMDHLDLGYDKYFKKGFGKLVIVR